MSGSATEYHENKTLELLRGSTYTAPAAVYSALYTVVPSDSTAGTEVTNASSGYTRVATTFSTAASGSVTNTGAVTFATAAAAYTVNGWALMDAATAGNALYWSTVTTTAFSIGDQAMFAVGGIVIAASESDEPTYIAGTDTLIIFDDLTSYASALAMSNSGSGIRFAPLPSPVADGGTFDGTHFQLLTGGPSGKYVSLIYDPSDGTQQSRNLYLMSPPDVEPLVQGFWSFDMRLTATGTMGTNTFPTKFVEWTYGSHDRVQWGTHGASPWAKGANPDHGTYWQAYNNSGYTDDVSAYPQGHDQATQPIGPYFNDLCDGSTWWRVTGSCRDHSTSGKTDGFLGLWINGTRILYQSRDTVGVTPSGGEKQWCGSDSVDNIFVDGESQNRVEWRVGCTSTALNGTPGVTIDVTNVRIWTRP